MPFLIAWLQAHIVAITVFGAVAGAVASAESVAINTDVIIQKAEEQKDGKP